MEGLIPLVFRSMKGNKTRRKYQCLSSGDAARSFDISEFYADGAYNRYQYVPTPPVIGGDNGQHKHRRRSSSYGEYSTGCFPAPEEDMVAAKPKHQMKRLRSHRFLSCVTGA